MYSILILSRGIIRLSAYKNLLPVPFDADYVVYLAIAHEHQRSAHYQSLQ
jgi:hypothetical protein